MFAQKNLVAAAALLAIAGAAQAQVKVYGTVDIGFGSFEAAHEKGTSDRVTKVNSGNMMTSYLGFSGSEDLGGGLKAEFALETFLNPDTGTTGPNMAGGFWGRGSNVALSGGFGKVALGQYDNPLFTSGYTYNPFGSSMVVSPTMRHLYSGGDFAAVGFDTGFVNSITYESPVVQGFNATLQFAPKESATSGLNNSYAAAGTYAVGPFAATLTYVKGGRTTTATSVTGYRADQKVTDLGASYDLGSVKLFGQFTSAKTSSTSEVSGSTATITTDTDGLKSSAYQLGASLPVSEKLSVMASYGAVKFKDNSGTLATDKVLSLGGDYLLSKRTDVYVAFVNNSVTAPSVSYKSGQTFAAGIKHNF